MKTVKIKTKRDKGPWRGTAIRALIDNPIYIGHMHMGEALSPIIDYNQSGFLCDACRRMLPGWGLQAYFYFRGKSN